LGRLIALAFLAVALAFIANATPCAAPVAAGVTLAEGGACTSACRAQYNQCRIATKGSPSCDAQFAACMQRCISSRRR
jgi:hypothetical protein